MGSSSWSPLRNTTSASASTAAWLGDGSNVWLFVPSGTTPTTAVSVPAVRLATMLVIGATVVTTRSGRSATTVTDSHAPVAPADDAVASPSSSPPQATTTSAPATRRASVGRIGGTLPRAAPRAHG